MLLATKQPRLSAAALDLPLKLHVFCGRASAASLQCRFVGVTMSVILSIAPTLHEPRLTAYEGTNCASLQLAGGD
jgi:hypothetical protein